MLITCVANKLFPDLYTSNVLYTLPTLTDQTSEHGLHFLLGKPKTIQTVRSDGKSISANVPCYGVETAKPPRDVTNMDDVEIRIIDFGQAWIGNEKPNHLVTPLALRAPELLFDDDWGQEVDIWSAGCAVRKW